MHSSGIFSCSAWNIMKQCLTRHGRQFFSFLSPALDYNGKTSFHTEVLSCTNTLDELKLLWVRICVTAVSHHQSWKTDAHYQPCTCVCTSLCMSLSLSVHLSLYVSLYTSLSECLSPCISPYTSLSVRLYIYDSLYTSLSVHLFQYISLCSAWVTSSSQKTFGGSLNSP